MPESSDHKPDGDSCLEEKRMNAWVNGELSPAEEEDFMEKMSAELSQRLARVHAETAALGFPVSEPDPDPEAEVETTPPVSPEWYEFRNMLGSSDFESASALLEKMPGLMEARNGIGETVLHHLAVENRQDAVEWLHAKGADLNAVNLFGRPLLFETAQLGYKDLILWLIRQGADPGQKDAGGMNLAEFLADTGHPEILDFLRKHFDL